MARIRKTPDSELKRIKELEEQFISKEKDYLDKIAELEKEKADIIETCRKNKLINKIMKDSVPFAALMLFCVVMTVIYNKENLGLMVSLIAVITLYLVSVFTTNAKLKLKAVEIEKIVSNIEAQIQVVNSNLTNVYKNSNRCIPRHQLDKLETVKTMLENREAEDIEQALKMIEKREKRES